MITTAVAEIVEKKYTVEEYFEFEKNSEIRHEFYYGKLIEMPGEAKIANNIANNILEAWRKKLKKNGYQLYTHNVKAQVKKRGVYRYPDVVVSPNVDDDEYLVEEPVIMVEVASQDSMKRDTVVKLKEYTAIPSLKYYLIVAQEEISVQFCYRNGSEWSFVFFDSLNDIIRLPDFSLEITLADIYDDVNLGESISDI
jgi:Uma2 family endonuclease